MYLKKRVIALLGLTLLLTACAPKVESSKPVPMKSIEEIPPQEEFVKYPLGKMQEVRDAIEGIPVEDCETHYVELLEAFLEEEEYELFAFEIEEDNLSLILGQNLKPRLNLTFRIDLRKSVQRDIDDVENAKELAFRIMDEMGRDTFFTLKAAEVVVSTYDMNGYIIDTSHMSRGSAEFRALEQPEAELRALEQPEVEYSAQTVAFNFKNKQSAFFLKKFGAIQETKELYVEYYVDDRYLGRGDVIRSNIDNLTNINDEITEYLLSEDAIAQYAQENGLEVLTISFWNGSLALAIDGREEPYLVFQSNI